MCAEAGAGPTRWASVAPVGRALQTSGMAAPLPARAARTQAPDGPAAGETCDYCGAATLTWRKCKLICDSCKQINKSCADL